MDTCIHAYLHTCIFAFLPTWLLAYVHTCILVYLYTCILACFHTWIPAYLHNCILAQLHTYIHAYLHSFIRLDYLHTYILDFLISCILAYLHTFPHAYLQSCIKNTSSSNSLLFHKFLAVWLLLLPLEIHEELSLLKTHETILQKTWIIDKHTLNFDETVLKTPKTEIRYRTMCKFLTIKHNFH